MKRITVLSIVSLIVLLGAPVLSAQGVPAPRPSVGDKQPSALPPKDEAQLAPKDCPACAMGLTAEFVFKRLDSDEDKQITVTEFKRSPGMGDDVKATRTVARLDRNGDGTLSWEELERAYIARHARCEKPDPKTLGKPRPAPGDGRGNGNRFARVFILRNDQDGDGKIGPAEFRGGAGGFKRLDKNKNGFIEVDELGELHQRRLNDPKTMKQRIEEGDVRRSLQP